MKITQFLEQLRQLEPHEQVGKRFFERNGYEMTYIHMFYMYQHPEFTRPEVTLAEPGRQEEMKTLFQQTGYPVAQRLSEQDFLKEGYDIEIEQLMRYIHIPSHRHEFFELVFVLCGHCRHVINGYESNNYAGDFTVVPPNLPHELFADEDCVCLTVKIRKENFFRRFSDILMENSQLSSYFSQILTAPYYQCALTIHSNGDEFIRDSILQMYAQQMRAEPYSDAIVQSLLTMIFAYYLQNYQDTLELLVSDSAQQEKMLNVLTYVFNNYQFITLSETAKHFYFSVPYLSTMIRKATGKTFTQLLRDYRLQKAAEILKIKNDNLDDVCEAVGYQNTAQFIRSFKEKYGMTPGQYRKTFREDK